jgi:hypothetical protein
VAETTGRSALVFTTPEETGEVWDTPAKAVAVTWNMRLAEKLTDTVPEVEEALVPSVRYQISALVVPPDDAMPLVIACPA